MKAILLSGGTGTRLYPLTTYTNKHLLPLSGLPMIYYPISFLISIGVAEILMVVNPKDEEMFKSLLGDGSRFGLKINYIIQHGANGLAEPLILSEKYINRDEKFIMMLGDNLFHVPNAKEIFKNFGKEGGATLVLTESDNPSAFGVVEVDNEDRVISIEEKPKIPKSNLIATGLYAYDYTAIEIAKKISASDRGELEITDVNAEYLKLGMLNSVRLSKDDTWFDCGTPETIKSSSRFIENIQGNEIFSKLGVVEENAILEGIITKEEVLKNLDKLKPSNYKNYLINFIKNVS